MGIKYDTGYFGGENMFNNLNAELARKGWNIKDLAVRTGIKYESLKNKMSGNTEFKRNEMLLIKREFPDHSLEYLFSV